MLQPVPIPMRPWVKTPTGYPYPRYSLGKPHLSASRPDREDNIVKVVDKSYLEWKHHFSEHKKGIDNIVGMFKLNHE
jgi:hypothetical protein